MVKVLVITFSAVIILVVAFNVNIVECNDLRELVSDISDEDADDMEPDGSRGCTNDWYVDHLKLTVQWGPGVCQSGDIRCDVRPKQEFLIHGLWPQKEGNRYPSFCCSPYMFDVSQLRADIFRGMNRYWPSLTSAPNNVFWNHEWQKHGTCAKKVGLNTQQDYFNFALEKFYDLKLNDVLRNFRQKPSNSAYFRDDDIIDMFSREHGRAISFNCRYRGNEPILTEIYYCYDKKLNPIDCMPPSAGCRHVKILE